MPQGMFELQRSGSAPETCALLAACDHACARGGADSYKQLADLFWGDSLNL